MAVATYRQRINGQVYNVGDTLPDYGDLYFEEEKDGFVSIKGNSTDFAKLPTWCNIGSTAYMIDTQKLYMFDGSTWVEQ